MSTEIGEYRTWGRYPSYGNIEIGKDNDVILNDFGNHNTIETDEEGATKSTAIDGLLGVGLRLNFNKSFAFDAGMQYQIGGKSWKANQGSIFSYSLEGGDKVNLLRTVDNNSLKVTASLIFKF